MTDRVYTAAEEPSTFDASFAIAITGIAIVTVGNRSDVVTRVFWTLTGTLGGKTHSIDQATDLGAPTTNFIPVTELKESDVLAWVETSDQRLNGLKHHVQQVLLSSGPSPVAPPWLPPVAEVALEPVAVALV